LRGSKNPCIFGESGNGKSWLYKHVFKQHGVTYHTINLALADAQDCLHAAFEAKADSIEEPKFEITTMMTGAFQPGGVGVGGGAYEDLKPPEVEPVERLFKAIRGSENRPTWLVLDNFEIVTSFAIVMKQIASLIMLLDDEGYAKYMLKSAWSVLPPLFRNSRQNRTIGRRS
jgi:hypothetical protein